MTLQVYTLALGNFRDDTSGNNYAANTPVYILNSGGTLADIFRDQAGAQPIAQDGLNNISDAYGEFTFYVNSGQYISRVAGRDRLINVVGSDYFDSRVDDAVEQITQQTLASRGFRVAGTFADGFTYELFNDVGIDADGNSWIYVGAGAPDKVVTAGTVPSVSAGYEQVTFNAASAVSNANGGSVQDFIDSFALKIFQSPTDGGLTEIQTRTVDAGEVYEVRKTSDNSFATIYSDAAGATEIVQNGASNVSDANAECVFYIANGDYTFTINAVSARLSVVREKVFESVADMTAANWLNIGGVVRTLGYYTCGDGGGNDYVIVAADTGTADGGSFIDLAGVSGQAKGLFVDGNVNVEQFGASTNISDNSPIVNAASKFSNTILFNDFYDGDGPLVLYSYSRVIGRSSWLSGYANVTGSSSGLSPVLDQTGGSTVYDVSADVIVHPGSAKASAREVHILNMKLGNQERTLVPQFCVYAPWNSGMVLSNLLMYGGTDTVFKSFQTYTSTFTKCVANGGYQTVTGSDRSLKSWSFGEDEVDQQNYVAMTSNTFISCGGTGSKEDNWYVRNGTYSSWTSCFSESSGGAFYFIDPNALYMSGCGDEKVDLYAVKVLSNRPLYGNTSLVIDGYRNAGGLYTQPVLDLEGKCDVIVNNFQPASIGTGEVRTLSGAKLTVHGGFRLTRSTTDSDSPIAFPDWVARFDRSDTTSFSPNDGVLFDSGGVSRFCMLLDIEISTSAKNTSDNTVILRPNILTSAGYLGVKGQASVSSGEWGSVTDRVKTKVLRGDSISFSIAGSNFEFAGGEGGHGVKISTSTESLL